jgi:hypothetical protein
MDQDSRDRALGITDVRTFYYNTVLGKIKRTSFSQASSNFCVLFLARLIHERYSISHLGITGIIANTRHVSNGLGGKIERGCKNSFLSFEET